jgi:hypothetical protein
MSRYRYASSWRNFEKAFQVKEPERRFPQSEGDLVDLEDPIRCLTQLPDLYHTQLCPVWSFPTQFKDLARFDTTECKTPLAYRAKASCMLALDALAAPRV